MAIIIRCGCEAVYEQIEIRVTEWVEDSADCRVCGYVLHSWRGHNMLSFNLIKNPTGYKSTLACTVAPGDWVSRKP